MINKSKIVKDAQKFVAKGQLDKAIAEYSKIISASPNDTNTQNTVGDLYLKVGNKEKAIDAFRAAADVLNKDGFTLKAIALYKKVLNINPDQVDVQMMMGKLNAERGMIGNANENYLAAASYFTKQGKRDRALEVYKVLCNLNPKNITLAQKLAELYMSEGMEAEGLSKLVDLAEIKLQDGNIAEAKQFLDRARKKGSERHDFMRVNALINLQEGRIPEAVSELEELRKLDPGDTRVLTILSDAYLHSGRYEDAASAMDEMLNEDPNNSEYRKKLINIFIKSGDFDSAWEQYRYIVEAHVDRKEYNKAQKLIQEYLEYNADSIEARQMLADMYTSIGREDRIAELHSEMADIYTRTGEYEKALNIYNKLLEQDPDNENYKLAIKNLGQMEAPEEVEETTVSIPEPRDAFTGFEETGAEEEAGIDGADFPGDVPEGASSDENPFGPDEYDEQEAQPGGGSIYDLSDMPDELPPLELGTETGDDTFTDQESGPNVYEIDEQAVGDIGDLDIFGAESGPEAGDSGLDAEPPAMDITDLESDEGPGPQPQTEEQAFQEGSTFEESLTEADVYIKYGLYPKAHEILSALEYSRPADPEIQIRFMEICKAQNDMDCFVERSLQLAGIYKSREMEEEARAVLDRAVALNPGDERLRPRVETPGEQTQVQPAYGEAEEKASEVPESEELAGSTGLTIENEEAEAGLAPGSVGFLEELAEADFYASQGLMDEARTIYRRLLTADPENEDIRTKYNSLAEMEQETRPPWEEPASGEGPREPGEPEQAFEPTAEEPVEDSEEKPGDELDEAFREMDFGEEEPALSQAGDEMSGLPQTEEPAREPAEEPAFTSTEGPAPTEEEDEGFFDLAAELREEMGPDIISPSVQGSALGDDNLDAVFQEFRKGVNEQIGDEDYETHYNLGIAYKEMGMIDEAISEFEEAGKDPYRTLDCASMLGLCHLEKGEYGKAIEHFRRGLDVPGREKEEYFGLKYDMATAYELSGDPAQAFSAIAEIYREDPEFRDVRKRYQRLDKSTEGGAGEDGAPAKDASKTKKSRVSYL